MSLPLDPAGAVPEQYANAVGCSPLTAKGRQLVEGLKPFMASKDTLALAGYLARSGWDEPSLVSLLTCTDTTIIRAATWTLAHIGTMRCNLPLASILHNDDPATVDLAENALWSVWLRAASPDVHNRLCAAIRLTEQDCCDAALAEMNAIIRTSPTFAEAYNQRAITRFLKSDYAGAAADYQQAFAINSVHFGAQAGLGHCCAALGRHRDALNAYRRTLEIHPRMEGIRTAISQVKRMVGTSCQTGHFPTYWAMS